MYEKSNVVPWQPPDGFVDPVSPAPHDSAPRAALRVLARLSPSLAPNRPAGDLYAIVRVMFPVVVFLALFGIGVLTDSANQDRSVVRDTSERYTELPADGFSSLPGNHASVGYTPLRGESEWVHRASIDAPDDGSEWWLSRTMNGRTEGVNIAYYVFEPPFDSPASLKHFRTQTQAENANRAKRWIGYKVERVAGQDAYVFRFSVPNGQRVLQAWLVGPVHSYRFECLVNRDDAELWRQCIAMLRSLKTKS